MHTLLVAIIATCTTSLLAYLCLFHNKDFAHYYFWSQQGMIVVGNAFLMSTEVIHHYSFTLVLNSVRDMEI